MDSYWDNFRRMQILPFISWIYLKYPKWKIESECISIKRRLIEIGYYEITAFRDSIFPSYKETHRSDNLLLILEITTSQILTDWRTDKANTRAAVASNNWQGRGSFKSQNLDWIIRLTISSCGSDSFLYIWSWSWWLYIIHKWLSFWQDVKQKYGGKYDCRNYKSYMLLVLVRKQNTRILSNSLQFILAERRCID